VEYLEFKKALQAIGEAEKAGEYWEFINGIESEIICINNSYSHISNNGRFYQAKYFPEIDLIIEKIKGFNPALSKVFLVTLSKSGIGKKYWHYTKAFDFIKAELSESDNMATPPPPATDQEPVKEKQSPDLSISQIALKSVFEGLTINRENANEIVKRFGHTSGEKLFQRFSYYSSYTNRTGKEITSKKFKNKIELFESVIELLPNANKQRAIIELKGLKILFENEFE
jgi:hypothetical protein